MVQGLIDNVIGHQFNEPNLLQEALTHPSVAREKSDKATYNYERLEFLGDAVLGLVIAEMLMAAFPEEKEGNLAKRQSGLVKGEMLAKIALELGIDEFIIMTPGEEAMGGRKNPNNLENTLEAIIGAIYLDGGLEISKQFINRYWGGHLNDMVEPPRDPKTSLQEWAQGNGLPIPEYRTVEMSGPSHAPLFTIEVRVSGLKPQKAKGDSKKKAEKKAAEKLLKKIEKDGYKS